MDKKLINEAIAQIDDQIVPSDFNDDWQAAMQSVHRSSKETVSGKKIVNFPIKNIFRSNVGLVSVTAGLLAGVLVIMLNVEPFSNAPDTSNIQPNVQTTGVTTAYDPNKIWHSPTDDLMQINVLKYQNQWVTFATYDPITMEIK